MALSSEKKKQIAAVVLAAIAVTTIVYSVFFSDGSSSSRSTASRSTSPKPGNRVIPGINSPINPEAAAAQTAASTVLVSQPLDLGGMDPSTSPSAGRNIFVYPPPPPPPTPRPTPTPTPAPPPPITITGLIPNSAVARTADFTMTVSGVRIPADARVLINGASYPTTVVSETQVKANIPSNAIANPGSLQVEVRGASDPAKSFSNRLTLNVAAPPIPQYRYLGLIVKNGISIAFIRDEGESDLQGVKVGQRLGTRWQISNITPGEITITDVTINIRHRIPFTGEGG